MYRGLLRISILVPSASPLVADFRVTFLPLAFLDTLARWTPRHVLGWCTIHSEDCGPTTELELEGYWMLAAWIWDALCCSVCLLHGQVFDYIPGLHCASLALH